MRGYTLDCEESVRFALPDSPVGSSLRDAEQVLTLPALVDQVEREHEVIEITRHGHPAAVLMSKDALDALHETCIGCRSLGYEKTSVKHGDK